MQNFRLLPALVGVALCSIPFLTRADDTPAQAAARAALEEQMNQMNAGQTNAPMPAPEQPAPAPSTPAPPVAPAPVPQTNQTAGNPNGSWSLFVQTNAPPAAAPPQVTVSPQFVAPEQPTNAATAPLPPLQANQPAPPVQPPVVVNPPSTSSGFRPVLPPPLPISAEKQAELQELLSRYMADQITPAQYQEERAKIMAQPN